MAISVIITGVTGMVGEGVLLTCLDDPNVSRVLALARKPLGRKHPKLSELIVPDFLQIAGQEAALQGYDALFYCAGISSLGVSEEKFTVAQYDTPLRVAEAMLRQNPASVFIYVTGAGTDSSEKGRIMWARVKGRAENALARMPFGGVYNFRPGIMKPVAGQTQLKRPHRIFGRLYPAIAFLFPRMSSTLREVGRAMIRCVTAGFSKHVVEVPDIKALAAAEPAGS